MGHMFSESMGGKLLAAAFLSVGSRFAKNASVAYLPGGVRREGVFGKIRRGKKWKRKFVLGRWNSQSNRPAMNQPISHVHNATDCGVADTGRQKAAVDKCHRTGSAFQTECEREMESRSLTGQPKSESRGKQPNALIALVATERIVVGVICWAPIIT